MSGMPDVPPSVKVVIGPRLSLQRDAVLTLLKEIAAENWTYFDENRAKSLYHARIAECCNEIDVSSSLISELVLKVEKVSQKCDYDEKTPGNGFRSLICVCDMVILHLVSVLKTCADSCSNAGFRLPIVCKDLENYVATLRFLILAFQQVALLIDSMDEGSLFPSLEGNYNIHDGFFKAIESLDASCFYGRIFGFQFVPSVMTIFNVIGIALSTYSLSWGSSDAFGSLLNSGRYLLSAEQRAKQIIKVIREADIEFCRGFWNLSEIPSPKLFCPPMEVYETTFVPMSGELTLKSKEKGLLIPIPEPSAHGPSSPIPIRILSAKYRDGLSTRPRQEPLSDKLVIHCHGGGYVATTSKSHETYLRFWARYLDCPIVSIDYSLSPEFPYPRPTEEVLYTYAWILKNPEKFGWTGKKVVFVGDSAGGNLIVSFTLKLIELGASRLPDGIVPIYTPFLFQYLPSPSRVLSFADPLLHMGVVIRCAAAYTGACPEGTESEISRRDDIGTQKHKSLVDYVERVKSDKSKNCTVEKISVMDIEKTTEEYGDNEENTNVQIDQDPSYISLSACNYNHSLINYLKSHPLTMASTGLTGECQMVEDVFDSEDMLCEFPFDNDGEFKYKTRCIAQRITLAGDKPIIREKKESVTRSVVRSVTSGVSHAFERISHYMGSNSVPVGHDDRAKVAHAANVGFEEAAKDERVKAEEQSSVLAELLKLNLPRDHLISPMYTSDEILKQLPPFRFIALHLDPLLDDTITFAKKLRGAGGKISSLDILHGLPHGFLNFSSLSEDCYEGARICMRRVEEALNI